MKYFITGGAGQLGYDLIKELKKRKQDDYLAPTIEELDITDLEALRKVVKDYNPDVIYHLAAYTAVDKAEENKDLCYQINVVGTENIVSVAKEVKAKVIYISTDYIFQGNKDGIYEVLDEANPINYYGYTKFLGEEEVKKLKDFLIVRISWVFGLNGNNFIKTMLRLASENKEISVVSDQVGSPTYTKDLARLLVDMIETEKYGIYHATNEGGYISWYDFACEIFREAGMSTKVVPVTTEEYGLSKAARPFNSRLEKKKLIEAGFEPLPTWQDALKRYIAVLKEEKFF